MNAGRTDMKKPIDLDELLAREIDECRQACERIENGRTALAEHLGIRLSEVSRYFERSSRKPNGRILAGMRAFVQQRGKAKRTKRA